MTVEPIDLSTRLDAAHLAVYNALPADLLDLSDIDRTRSGLAAILGAMPAPELPAGVTVEDVMVPGLGGDPEVMVRLYRPESLSGGTDGAGAPALYWIHGGGMVLGSVEMSDLDCAQRAAAFGCLVASVEYRLAPEHPFPAPMNDCYAGLSWLAINATDLGIDPNRIAIGGASAGGGLAAGLALMARDRGGPSICFQLLVYPMLDHRNDLPSTHGITDSKVWNRAANRAGWDAYLSGPDSCPGGEVPAWASPAMASDLSDLPPAYLNVGEFDMFLDEDLAYGRALLQAGVPCELRVYPGAFHGSNGFVSESALSKRWRADEDDALRRALLG